MHQKRRLFHDKIFQDLRMRRRCRSDNYSKQHQTGCRQNYPQLGTDGKRQDNCADHRQKAEKIQQIQLKQFPELSAEYLKKAEKALFLRCIFCDTGTGTLVIRSKQTHRQTSFPKSVPERKHALILPPHRTPSHRRTRTAAETLQAQRIWRSTSGAGDTSALPAHSGNRRQ